MVKLTPGMKQYMEIKNNNPDCVVLFRMGDFYETFFEDAKTVARELEITLTARGKGEAKAPLAGIPYHAIEPYLSKLVKRGYKVAIVEQIEDPKKAKGLVKRDIARIVTPGTVVDSGILEKEKNNYIMAISYKGHDIVLSFCDISTGEYMTTTVPKKDALTQIKKLNPAEIIYKDSEENLTLPTQLKKEGFYLNRLEEMHFEDERSRKRLLEHFNVINLKGFGVFDPDEVKTSAALLYYIKKTQKNDLSHIKKISRYETTDLMFLDSSTIRNLEILHNIVHKSDESTLLRVIDKTVTPMGKRLIKKWITSPLIKKEHIKKRRDSVGELKENMILRQDLKTILDNVYDLERLIGRISYGNANPKDLVSLKNSLRQVPNIREGLSRCASDLLRELSHIPELSEAKRLIEDGIKEEPSIVIREGNIIKEGYNDELDELKSLTIDAKTYISELEQKERDRTNIRSLKIRYNKVIGYFIEVTKANLHLVPGNYIRKQSQLNSERFITEELKDLETKIITAQERIYELEFRLFNEIVIKLKEFTSDIQDAARIISTLDCIVSLSGVAQERGYTKPEFNEEKKIEMIDSKHPVIESQHEAEFIPNDCVLADENRTMIITGPNMAGKSTYLRQVALIVLMAQMGSFVPAKRANLPIVDRIFSRIGAYDDLTNEQSTFMVEMNETANILNNATEDSLVILDEIGRGTSTFDGVSLAWAISEQLNNKIRCKTLFATHYHHLNKMSEKFDTIRNYNIKVEESDTQIIFLRKIVPGGTDKSYGIQVARLAGVPDEVINNAMDVMRTIEKEDVIAEKLISRESALYSSSTKTKDEQMIAKEIDSLYESHTAEEEDDKKQKLFEEKTFINRPESEHKNEDRIQEPVAKPEDSSSGDEQDEEKRIDKLEEQVHEIRSILEELRPLKKEPKEDKSLRNYL